MIVLENLTYRFVRPNVLDIKLGTQLYDEDASPDKVQRMIAASKACTSFESGVRLTGFQNWDTHTQAYVQSPKAFGKAIKVDQLEDGLARFLAPFLPARGALPPPFDKSSAQPKTADSVTPASGLGSGSASGASDASPKLVLEVLEDLTSRLRELESILATLPIRMRGGSLLIVTEGDPASLAAALTRENEALERMRATDKAARGGEDDDAESDDDDESVASSSDSQGAALPHTCRSLDVRLIDFAHTREADPALGESGGDEGVLLGVATVRRLVDAIRARVAEVVRKEAA